MLNVHIIVYALCDFSKRKAEGAFHNLGNISYFSFLVLKNYVNAMTDPIEIHRAGAKPLELCLCQISSRYD